MPVDAVFCDQSGREFNEFVPVDLLLGPYLNDLQSSAAAVDSAVASEGESVQPMCDGRSVNLDNLCNVVCKVCKLVTGVPQVTSEPALVSQ